LGRVEYENGNYRSAFIHLRKSILKKSCTDQNSLDLAKSLDYLGLVFATVGDF
jgi:hypothetical protein